MKNDYINLKIDLENLIDMIIVNEKQKKAVNAAIDGILRKHLMKG